MTADVSSENWLASESSEGEAGRREAERDRSMIVDGSEFLPRDAEAVDF